MKGGTQEYDIMVFVGVVILVFVIIYWTLTYGVAIMADLLYFAPSVMQDSLASFVTIESTQVNTNISLRLGTGNMPMHISLKDIVDDEGKSYGYEMNVVPPGKYFYGKRVQRGGYVEFLPIEPISVITCDETGIVSNDRFSIESTRSYIIVERKENEIIMGVE